MFDGSSAASVLFGLDEFEVVDAVETDDGVMEVEVRVARPEAPYLVCGMFSARVKQHRTQRVKDGLSFERSTALVWCKRRFRRDTPVCRKSFTESTDQVPSLKRLTRCLRDELLHRVRRDLIRARENLTDRDRERLAAAFAFDWNDELECAVCAQLTIHTRGRFNRKETI